MSASDEEKEEKEDIVNELPSHEPIRKYLHKLT